VKKPQRRAQLALLAAAALTVTALLPGSAAVAKSTPGTQATIQVLASGLNVPRGLVFDGKNKRILVAESGIDAINVTGPCGIGEDGTPLCYADTGSVFQYSTQTGATSRIVTGLPSVSIPDGGIAVLGLHDLALFKGTLHGVFGLLGMVSTRQEFAAQGAAHAFDLGTAGTFSGGSYHQYADVTAFEDSLEPGQESDPYGIIVGGFGSMIANPGGPVATGNDVLQFKNGQLTQATSIATRIINNRAIESVPTCVTKGPDGAFYAGELTGFPYFPGVARILRFMPGQAPTVFATGFTNIIDCTFDDDGNLLVLEIAKFGLLNADQTGALFSVDNQGNKTELVSTGLTNPGGVAPAGDGVYYITNFTAGFGGDGELLKVTVS
jgi:hypothetical protein